MHLILFQNTPHIDMSENNSYYEKSFRFYDQSLVDALRAKDKESQTFFRLLALCHTVMPDYKLGEYIYQIFFIKI